MLLHQCNCKSLISKFQANHFKSVAYLNFITGIIVLCQYDETKK